MRHQGGNGSRWNVVSVIAPFTCTQAYQRATKTVQQQLQWDGEPATKMRMSQQCGQDRLWHECMLLFVWVPSMAQHTTFTWAARNADLTITTTMRSVTITMRGKSKQQKWEKNKNKRRGKRLRMPINKSKAPCNKEAQQQNTVKRLADSKTYSCIYVHMYIRRIWGKANATRAIEAHNWNHILVGNASRSSFV